MPYIATRCEILYYVFCAYRVTNMKLKQGSKSLFALLNRRKIQHLPIVSKRFDHHNHNLPQWCCFICRISVLLES